MKIILDTHIFLWALTDPLKIDKKRRQHIESLANTIYVSSISVTEMMIKASMGKLQINFDVLEMIEKSGFEQLDYRAEDALGLKELPFHHKDPFDRMLIAQANANNYYMMSDDGKFGMYACKLL